MPRLKSAGRVLAAVRNNPRLELVVAGCVVYKGKVLLVWHKKHKEWLPPGGHLEQNESPNDAVLREVLEETGFTSLSRGRHHGPIKYIRSQLVTPFFADTHNVGDHDHCCFYYLMRLRTGKQSVTLNLSEVEEFHWFSKSDLTREGIPEDIRHICGLALAVQHSTDGWPR